MAALMGRDVEKLKNSSKGKWKYMAEQEMIDIADKFSPYRYVADEELIMEGKDMTY
jgi:DNA-3-methyladenine glycosylase II